MIFNEKTAAEIVQKHGLSPTTIRVWRTRGKIPNRYAEKEQRVLLTTVLTDTKIEAAITKYGEEMKKLLNTRLFKAGQKDSYYNLALISLARECKSKA